MDNFQWKIDDRPKNSQTENSRRWLKRHLKRRLEKCDFELKKLNFKLAWSSFWEVSRLASRLYENTSASAWTASASYFISFTSYISHDSFQCFLHFWQCKTTLLTQVLQVFAFMKTFCNHLEPMSIQFYFDVSLHSINEFKTNTAQ